MLHEKDPRPLRRFRGLHYVSGALVRGQLGSPFQHRGKALRVGGKAPAFGVVRHGLGEQAAEALQVNLGGDFVSKEAHPVEAAAALVPRIQVLADDAAFAVLVHVISKPNENASPGKVVFLFDPIVLVHVPPQAHQIPLEKVGAHSDLVATCDLSHLFTGSIISQSPKCAHGNTARTTSNHNCAHSNLLSRATPGKNTPAVAPLSPKVKLS
mmetsp:Transcript_43006/g.86955  ORF Transcript_43006/g.86955 Transcript_43006/m.86955 type:complete len:211 (+) Transcript_43006:374-1006(+)